MAHPDCCGGDDDHNLLGCPLCGGLGHAVSSVTLHAMLPSAALEAGDEGFRFCGTPECGAVYYAPGGGAPILRDGLAVRVGVKEDGADAPLCYCFGINRGQVARAAQDGAPASVGIRTRIKAEGCHCERLNPSGRCCLGDVEAVERESGGQASGRR